LKPKKKCLNKRIDCFFGLLDRLKHWSWPYCT